MFGELGSFGCGFFFRTGGSFCSFGWGFVNSEGLVRFFSIRVYGCFFGGIESLLIEFGF